MGQNNEHNKEGLKTVYNHTITLIYGTYAKETAQVKK